MPYFRLFFLLCMLGAILCCAPSASAQQPRRLTLKDAIQLALKSNLSLRAAETRAAEASGTRDRRFSSLLPHSHIETPVTLKKVNLAALGITFPGAPVTVGPFSTYDFRLYLDQPVVDLQSYHVWKASEKHEESVHDDYQDSRDLIIRQVASLYLNAQSAAALVDSTQSRVDTSQRLLKLATDQRESGVATGIDVLRAKVQLANDQQALLVAQNGSKQALLLLARSIGVSLGAPLELAEALEFRQVPIPEISDALNTALANRPDFLSLLRQRDEQREQQRASRARTLPRFAINGNYGGIGRTFGGITSTYTVQGTLSFNVFDKDIEGEREEIASRLSRLDTQITDLSFAIEEELREAILNLESTENQVKVAQDQVRLSQEELDLARVRFKSGVANNIEVTTAQDSVSHAQQSQIAALTRYTDAKIALARALGGTEKNFEQFLGQ